MTMAAIYARVSTERQEKEKTIESQLEALDIRARELGLIVNPDMVFRDDGFSGSRLDRPALDSLRDAAAEGRFRILLVYDADRLARNFVHQEILLEEFEKSGVTVEFMENPPSRDPEGRLLSQVKGIFAEYERTKIMERTRREKLHKARYQGWLNWSTVPYGYTLVRMPEGTRVQINQEEAEWVRQIYSWSIEQGMATRKIAKKLNDLGVRTRRGGIWRSTTIRDILSRPLYSGTAYYNRTMSVEPVRRRNPHKYPRQLKSYHKVRPMDQWIAIPVPPIVSEEEQMLARKAAQSRRLNSPRKTKYEYLLRRLVVCGECGRKMDCVSMRAKNRDIRYSYYSCKKKEWLFHEEQCKARRVRADWLDDAVWNAMKSWIMEPETLKAELNSVLSIPEKWDSIERQWNDLSSLIRGYESQISRITDAYQSGAIELDDLRKRRDILMAKISDAEKRRDEIAALRQREISMESILSDVESFAVTIRNGLETLTFQERRRLVELLVERVIVKGNEVTVENVVPLKGRFSVLCKDGRDIFFRPEENDG